jgi:hypothetical protein
VHGFVHETRQDGLRRGRPLAIGEDTRNPYAEASANISETARDGKTDIVWLITQRRNRGTAV